MIKEFKAFIMRGNVLDLAVAVIVGASFGKIITSLVNDLLMPPIGFLVGKVDFGHLYLNLSSSSYATLTGAEAAGAPVIKYGLFINELINFLIVAFAIFLIVRLANSVQRPAAESPSRKECPYCLSTVPVRAVRCSSCTSDLKP